MPFDVIRWPLSARKTEPGRSPNCLMVDHGQGDLGMELNPEGSWPVANYLVRESPRQRNRFTGKLKPSPVPMVDRTWPWPEPRGMSLGTIGT
jgi:hypothetical protein